MKFSDNEFSRMKYNIHSLAPDQHVFEAYPMLRIMFEEVVTDFPEDKAWRTYIDENQLVKYIVYTYHRLSPLVAKIPSIIERKKEALILAGVNLESLTHILEAKELIGKIILSRHEFTSHLSLQFLKQEDSLTWLELNRVMESYEDALHTAQKESEGTEKKSAVEIATLKAKLYEATQIYRNRIEELSDKLFKQDLALQDFINSNILAGKRKPLITPEHFATLSKSEKDEIFSRQGLAVR